MNNLTLMRLSTGEFVVGKTGTDMVWDSATDCFLVQLQQVAQGQFRMGIIPYMAPFDTSTDGSMIDKKFIVTSMPCPDEVYKAYIQFTSNIMVADNLSMIK